MPPRLQPAAFGVAAALVNGLIVLLLAGAARLGIYGGAARMASKAYAFFSPTVPGIILGIVEAAVLAFAVGWVFARCYNAVLDLLAG